VDIETHLGGRVSHQKRSDESEKSINETYDYISISPEFHAKGINSFIRKVSPFDKPKVTERVAHHPKSLDEKNKSNISEAEIVSSIRSVKFEN